MASEGKIEGPTDSETLSNATDFEPLMLMVHRRTRDGEEIGFFGLQNHNFSIRLPSSLGGQRCCGCLGGWLVMISDTMLQLSLFNLVSHTQVSLPSQPKCFLGSNYEDPPISRVKKVILSAPPTDENCMVAAIAGYNIILLCRPGHEEWAVFEGPLSDPFEDIIFFDGRLYAIAITGKLITITVDSQLRGTIDSVVQPLPEMKQKDISRYLVESTELFVRGVFAVAKRYISPNMKFAVYKLDGDRWIPFPRLLGCCLFLGVRCELIPVYKLSGAKPDCVYFTSKLPERIAPDGVGVYSLENDSVEPFAIRREGCLTKFEHVWVRPTLHFK